MKKKNISKKVLAFIILSVTCIGGAILYWSYYNAQSTIVGIREHVLELDSISGIKAKAEVENAVQIEQELNNKYVIGNFKQAAYSFFKTWIEKLAPAQVRDHRNNIKSKAAELEISYGALSGNQLIAIMAITLIFLVFIYLCLFTNLLRDPQGNAHNTSPIEVARASYNQRDDQPNKIASPFSLSRTQLAVWITIISCVYVYAILWDYRSIPEINKTALLLMGISAGTFAIGAVLDTVEIQNGVVRHQELQPSVNFFRDILSDNNGISIHRFQNVVWTVVAIVVYFYRYKYPPTLNFNDLPVLDSTLLALTGISSATYLTLKTRENASLNKPVTLKIKLSVDPALAGGASIMASPEGVRKAEVNIVTDIGDKLLPW